LASRPYPGRGILVARTGDGALCFAYLVTGRSASSRARELRVAPNGDVAVADTSGSGEADALRHYVALAQRGDWVVLGNGDHVEPLATALAAGEQVSTAWAAHTFEPDPPIFTPRIWLARYVDGTRPACLMGYVRRSGRGDGGADRVAWAFDELSAHSGVLMTTYAGTVTDVVPSLAPVEVTIAATDADDLLDEVWDGLAPQLRVAALTVAADDVIGSTGMEPSGARSIRLR
jgi:IMP cyclohydrolase